MTCPCRCAHSLSDASLNVRLHETPERSIILLEDVDAIFVERETASSRMQLGVTFRCVLVEVVVTVAYTPAHCWLPRAVVC